VIHAGSIPCRGNRVGASRLPRYGPYDSGEVLNFSPDYIERRFAHAVRDPNGRLYRTAYLAERNKMMQAWADYLGVLKTRERTE
jgi:hypothetical protein